VVAPVQTRGLDHIEFGAGGVHGSDDRAASKGAHARV
jgi:hypothetical protein